MTALSHVYLTAHGSYNTGAWLGESAQIGLRLPFVSVLAAPDKGSVFTPVANGDLAADSGNTAGTNGTLSRTWEARIGNTGSTDNVDAAYQIDLAEDFRTFLDSIKTYQTTSFRWTHVKIAGVDTTGAIPLNSAVYTFTTPIAGSQTAHLPPQLSLAVSMRANLVGRRGRGRFYLPALYQTAIAADGTVNTGMATAFRTAMKTLIDNLQDPPGTPDYIPIVSIMSADSTTAVRPLEVRTGNRMDTMQSRRRQVAESYSSTAL